MIKRNTNLTLIPYGSHEEWLGIRRQYIGGSDAGAIIGMNPFSSAFSVWAEKTGKVPEFEGNVRTKVGNELEDFVAHMFMDETGKRVQRCNFTIVNHEYPWACANIDRELVSENAVLEIKTTNSFLNTKMFRNGEYPDMWYTQMTHYLAVTGAEMCYLAVLSECRDFQIFELQRDEAEIKALMEAEQAFWNSYVLTGKTPPVDGNVATTDTIRQLFGDPDEGRVDLAGLEDVFQQRKTLNGQIKALKEQMDSLDNQIKVIMGNATNGSCGPWSVSWKLQGTSGLDRDRMKQDFPAIDFSKYSTQSRVFRVTEKKTKSA